MPDGAIALTPRGIEKPWGSPTLPAALQRHARGARTGEIWFEPPDGAAADLLVKMLFTTERLSVQVHPCDDRAAQIGLPCGKDEAWYVLAADPGATIGVGITRPMTTAELAAAARDGSIVDLMEWREVVAGDVLYVPAGTIHALGGGLQLVEIQQPLDVTYRLYDYGRPRELHLDDGLAAATIAPYGANAVPRSIDAARNVRCAGGKFVLEELHGAWAGTLAATAPVWLVMVAGAGRLGDAGLAAGSVWLCDTMLPLTLAADSQMLIGYCGGVVQPELLRRAEPC